MLRGHAIECRIYAEDPDNNFFPSPGEITSWRIPQGPGIRFDDGVYAGFTVPGDYDPLLGKLIASGSDRAEAIARLQRALQEFDAGGIRTNAGLFRAILADPEFVRGEIYTRWLDERLDSLRTQMRSRSGAAAVHGRAADAAAIAAALWTLRRATASRNGAVAPTVSRWKLEGRSEQVARDPRPLPNQSS